MGFEPLLCRWFGHRWGPLERWNASADANRCRLDPLRPDRAADVTNEEVAHLLCIARDYDAESVKEVT